MIIRPPLHGERPAVTELLVDRERHDRRQALSEHKLLRIGSDESLELVAVGGVLVGYAQAAHHPSGASPPADARPGDRGHWAAEVVTAPDVAGEAGLSAALMEAIAGAVPVGERATVWAWRAADLAAVRDLGLAVHRVLLEMRRPLPLEMDAPVPDGFVVRTFRPGEDEAAWLAANNSAFAGHPENGALDDANLGRRTSQSWFDPQGFLLAWRGDRLEGFCWTKRHDHAVGEIYIIGVVPEAQRQGLGRALLVAGLDDLHRRQGAAEARLFTDAADRGAVDLYRSLGFDVSATTREFVLKDED